VPRIAVQPLAPRHRAKWHDWADTLDLQVEFHRLAPSSLRERLRASPLAALHSGYRLLDRFGSAFGRLTRGLLIEQAAQSLAAAVAAPPQLSTAAALDRCRTRMLERLDALRRAPRQPATPQPCYTAAYHG